MSMFRQDQYSLHFPPLLSRRGKLAAALVLFATVLLSGCSGSATEEKLAWKDLLSPEGGFQVSMPGEAHYQTNSFSETSLPVHLWQVQLDRQDTGFFVHYFDLPAGVLPDLTDVQDQLRSAFPQALLQKTRTLSLDGYRGWEFTLSMAPNITIVRRIYIVEGRVYFITVSSSRPDVMAEIADQFFASFQLLKA
jgi:hypothetical protein